MMTCRGDAEAVETAKGVEVAEAAEDAGAADAQSSDDDLQRQQRYRNLRGLEDRGALSSGRRIFQKLLGKNGIMPGDPGKPDYVIV
jgi:hypothetical protein